MASWCPATPALAQLFLDLAASQPQAAQQAAWVLPLVAGALTNSMPPAAPVQWLQVDLADFTEVQNVLSGAFMLDCASLSGPRWRQMFDLDLKSAAAPSCLLGKSVLLCKWPCLHGA